MKKVKIKKVSKPKNISKIKLKKVEKPMIEVKAKRLSETAILPTYGSKKAACMDLYADIKAENIENDYVEIHSMGKHMVKTGWAFQPPEGYVALIFARSGLASKQGLRPANCVGVCDEDYRGEYMVALRNDTDSAKVIKHGDRIAQMMFIPYEQAILKEVKELDETERGEGGFGSTGVNLKEENAR
jgi:dUTP pyrophosphatase